MDQVAERVKAYILEEFLPGEDPNELTASTPLRGSGILDSVSTLKLVTFLEEEFGLELEARDVEQLGTLEEIARLVHAKRAGG